MGCIRKRNKSYQAQIRRQGIKPISKTFFYRKDAQKWIRDIEAKIDRGEYEGIQPCEISLRELLQRYLEEITPSKKGHATETRRINRLIRDDISNKILSELTGSSLALFRDRRLKDGKRACQYDLVIIRHAIEVGRKEWGLVLSSNPVDLIRIPNGVRRRQRRLEVGEWEKLRLASKDCTNPYTWPAVMLALYTGMRRSELLRLRWVDLDMKAHLAHLRDTKNGDARSVPLSSEALSVIQSLPSNNDYLLPVSDNALRQSWERLVKRAGIKDFRFHDFRHEAISRFFEMGLSMPEVAIISGHKDPRMLFRYTHLSPEKIARELNKLL
jgi:integrase